MVSVVRPLHGTAWLWSRYFLQSCLLLSFLDRFNRSTRFVPHEWIFWVSQTLWRFEPSSNIAVEQLQVGRMPPLSVQVFISNFNFDASWILISWSYFPLRHASRWYCDSEMSDSFGLFWAVRLVAQWCFCISNTPLLPGLPLHILHILHSSPLQTHKLIQLIQWIRTWPGHPLCAGLSRGTR